MGYEIRVTRIGCDENDFGGISVEEWRHLVNGDPSLESVSENGDDFFIVKGTDHWLNWFDGAIYAKNPTNTVLEKLLEIAANLDAFVEGDDGERYEEADITKGVYSESLKKEQILPPKGLVDHLLSYLAMFNDWRFERKRKRESNDDRNGT